MPSTYSNKLLVWSLLVVNFVYHNALLLPKKMPIPKPLVDLRSDTITKPSPAMRKAMFDAEVGDDVYEEDPTVRKLEDRMATLFKKEKSLFFPTGTMANLAASMAWCNTRGSEVVLGDQSHMFIYEQANLAQIGGISPRMVANSIDGTLDLDLLSQAIRSANIHFPTTEMISLENTHNLCGGRVLSTEYTESVGLLAKRAGIALHIDGARIWNAAAASGTSVASLTASADSISACLSKGLGAPAGSVLVGPAAFIAKARRIRKALGGGMRQVGVLAAAGLQALDDFDRGLLSADHSKARKIAQGLSEVTGLRVDPVETNIVQVHIDNSIALSTVFAAKLQEQGVKVLPRGAHSMRIVTHRDLSEEDVPAVVAAFRHVAEALWGASTSSATVIPALVLTGLIKPDFIPVHVTSVPPVCGPSSLANTTTSSANASFDEPSVVSVPTVTPAEMSAEVPVVTALPEKSVMSAMGANKNKSDPANDLLVYDESSHSVPTATVAASTTAVSPGIPAQATPLVHYEEATIRGMSVSPDGFCVILQGTVSNRCVRVLVTPEDPMSDGLDHDEVESSEAVTLLQLLQGIDIESFLAKDALVTKFGSTGPAGARVKYDLKAVLVNDAGKGRKFHGVLAGSPRVRPGTSPSAQTLDKIHQKDRVAGSVTDSAHDAKTSAHTEAAKNASASIMTLSPLETIAARTESEDFSHSNHTTSSTSSSSATTLSGFEREVPLDSAFYAIALALRHHVPIEVRSDLLQNEKISFSEREIATFYPKLLAASVKSPVAQGKDRTHMVERLKKRLTEALRQRNAEKIAQIQDQIASLGAIPPSTASTGANKSSTAATAAKGAAIAEPSLTPEGPVPLPALNAMPIGIVNNTQTTSVQTGESVEAPAMHAPHAGHITSPLQ